MSIEQADIVVDVQPGPDVGEAIGGQTPPSTLRRLALIDLCRRSAGRRLRAAARSGLVDPWVVAADVKWADGRELAASVMRLPWFNFPKDQSAEGARTIVFAVAGRREAAALLVPICAEAARAVFAAGRGCVVVSGGVTAVRIGADGPGTRAQAKAARRGDAGPMAMGVPPEDAGHSSGKADGSRRGGRDYFP